MTRKLMFILLLLAATKAEAQQINLSSLDKLSGKARETTDVNLDGSMLKFASGFLNDRKGEEAAAKKMIGDLKGVFVRTYEFDNSGAYSPADLQPIRDQLKGPQWNRIISVKDRDSGDDLEVWIYRDSTKGVDETSGLLLIASEPEELTVVNLVGSIRPEDLKTIGGQFGIPRIPGLTR
jgi:hypothetical protein